MAVTIYEIPKPTLELSLAAGGDLPDATTYYFIGVFYRGVSYYQWSTSAASDEVSITTTAPNQKIVATWKYPDGVGGWVYGLPLPSEVGVRIGMKWDNYSMIESGSGLPYKFNNLNDPAVTSAFVPSTGHAKWTVTYAGLGHSGTSVDLTTSNLYTNGQGRAFQHPEICTRYDYYTVRTNLTLDKGMLIVWITGDNNTEDDIINAFESCTYTDRFEMWRDNAYANARYSIQVYGSFEGTGNGVVTGLDITMLVGRTNLSAMEWKDCYITHHQLNYYNWLNLYGTYTDSSYKHNGNAFILDSLGSGTSNFAPWSLAGLTNYGSIVGLYSKDVPNHQYRYYRPSYVIENSTFDNTYLYCTGWSGSSGQEVFNWTNVTFKNASSFNVYFSGSYLDGLDIHQTFNIVGCTVEGRDYLRVRWVADDSNSWYCMLNIYADITFNITDNAGNTIDGATITITNANNEVVSGDTVNGVLSLAPKQYTVEYDQTDPDGLGDKSKTTDVSSFAITIAKDGYETAELYSNTLSGVESLSISLKKTVPVMVGTDGRSAVKVNPKNIGANRDKIIMT